MNLQREETNRWIEETKDGEAWLARFRTEAKARGLTGARIARDCGKSASAVNAALRGACDIPGTYYVPKYLWRYALENGIMAKVAEVEG